MKVLFFLIVPFIGLTLKAQESTVKVNTLNQSVEPLQKIQFKYPEFSLGKAVLMDNKVIEAFLNYNLYQEKVYFISPTGDTLRLLYPETYKQIIINSDTFYFDKGRFLQLSTHYPGANLVKREFIKLVGREKKGAFGTYSSTTDVTSSSVHVTDGTGHKTKADENLIFQIKAEFFLADRFQKIFAATKKNFYNLFSKDEKKLSEYLNRNNVNFHDEKDLLSLINYMYQ